MIRINDVSKTYAKSQVKAVDGINLEVKSGEIFGFLGPNGAGKSTTIKMLTGILTPDSGTIQIADVNTADDPVLAKSKVGYVPDNHETYDTLKGIEYLNFIGTMFGMDAAALKDNIEKYAALFNMTDALGSLISSYSHGMKQKIMVIAALIHDPEVWILDEPLTGLDPQSAFQIKTIMRERADAGKTVFFSSHVIDVVEKVCDRIAIINNGKIIAVDTLDNIRQSNNVTLEQIFLSLTSNITAE
jgi:ABC-2 type transport system ATP-binding protein